MTLNYEPNVTIHWMEDVSAVCATWTKLHLTGERFLEIANSCNDFAASKNSKILIVDQYDGIGTHPKEVQDIIASGQLDDKSKDSGVKMLLTVMPKSLGLASISAKKWTKSVGSYTLTFKLFETMEECKQWIREQNV